MGPGGPSLRSRSIRSSVKPHTWPVLVIAAATVTLTRSPTSWASRGLGPTMTPTTISMTPNPGLIGVAVPIAAPFIAASNAN